MKPIYITLYIVVSVVVYVIAATHHTEQHLTNTEQTCVDVPDQVVENIHDNTAINVSLAELDLIVDCIYYEARNNPEDWPLVLASILNRVESPRWPDTVQGVIDQPFAYSWTLLSLEELVIRDKGTRADIWLFVHDTDFEALLGQYHITHYHNHKVRPSWSVGMVVVQRTATHVFYESK